MPAPGKSGSGCTKAYGLDLTFWTGPCGFCHQPRWKCRGFSGPPGQVANANTPTTQPIVAPPAPLVPFITLPTDKVKPKVQPPKDHLEWARTYDATLKVWREAEANHRAGSLAQGDKDRIYELCRERLGALGLSSGEAYAALHRKPSAARTIGP